MIFLTATALGTGLMTAAVLAPVSYIAAAITSPLVASLATVLAGLLIAQRNTGVGAPALDLDGQADEMVAALKSVAVQAQTAASAPAASHKAA